MNPTPRIALALALSAAGCAETLEGTVAVEARFQTELLREVCRSWVRCPAWSWRPEALPEFTSTEACVARQRPYLSTFRALSEAVAEGRARFDVDAANRCLRRVRAYCSPVWRDWLLSGFCSDVYTGAGGPGAACRVPQECAPGTRCELPREGGCGGVCRPLPRPLGEPGERCASRSDCRPVAGAEVFCQGEGGGSAGAGTCVARTLEAPAAEGAPCGNRFTGAGRATWTPCAEGSYCSAVTGDRDPRCVRYRGEGDPCTGICRADLVCAGWTCVAPEYVRAEGAACDPASRFCASADGLECVEGRCRRVGDGSRGSRCRAGLARLPCAPGLACDPDHRCSPPGPAGARCDADDQCATGRCDFGAGRCGAVACAR